MNFNQHIDRIEDAIWSAYASPKNAERIFERAGLPAVQIIHFLKARAILGRCGEWIGERPNMELIDLVTEEIGLSQKLRPENPAFRQSNVYRTLAEWRERHKE